MRVIAELQALCPVCNGAPSPLSLYLCEADHEGRGSLVQCALCAMPTSVSRVVCLVCWADPPQDGMVCVHVVLDRHLIDIGREDERYLRKGSIECYAVLFPTQCPQCMECPVCRTRLHVVGSDNRFTYTCPYCAWEPASLCEATPSALLGNLLGIR